MRISTGLDHPDPARDELDRQRQAIEADTDLGHGARVRRGEGEVRPHRPGALDEQRDRSDVQERGRIEAREVSWQGEWWDGELLLAIDVQHAATRDQHREAGRRSEELLDQGARGQQMLEVVEDEQYLEGPQMVLQDRVHRPGGVFTKAEGARDRRPHERRIGEGRQIDEVHAVAERTSHLRREPDREPRLASPPGPRQGQQAGRPQELERCRDLLAATDEAREL